MDFSYKSYADLIKLLIERGYKESSYDNYLSSKKSYIIRHDVDYSLEKAVDFAGFENNNNIKSTYFVMLTNDFYNVFSLKGNKNINIIMQYGHEIALHFDECAYPNIIGKPEMIKDKIIEEIDILSSITGTLIKKVSMHRPSKEIIEANLELPGIINTYSKEFFTKLKYLSDSRMRWREPIEEIIMSGKENRFQILIHPFWYSENYNSIEDIVRRFVNSGNKQRYEALNDNISNLSEIMSIEDVEGII